MRTERHVDGRTDMTKLIVGFRNLAKVTKKLRQESLTQAFFFIYTLFTLHAPLQVSNTTCIVVTYLVTSLYSSLPSYL